MGWLAVACCLAAVTAPTDTATTCFAPELRPGAPLGCTPYKVFDGSCAVCGDGACAADEACDRCPADCAETARCKANQRVHVATSDSALSCGNDRCEIAGGETCKTCPMDCGACVFVGPYRYCEARDPPVLALTFDDGPTDTTTAVLDLLKEYGAHATFFNIANQARNPLAGRVLADGHVIGSHTYSHVELTELTEAEVLNDTLLASAAIGKLVGAEPKYMRPPFGRLSWSTPLALEKIGTKIIIWSGGVWPEEPDAVVANARATMRSGRSSIFMFHGEKDSDGAQHADMSTLRRILEAAKEMNVRLVNMTECLGDYLDGPSKSKTGSCVDDGCLCSGAGPGLPAATASSVCYKGDLSNSVKAVQVYADGVPDQCHHDPKLMNRDDLHEYEHWWNSHKATAAETDRVYRVARAENAELSNVRRQLTDCITAPKEPKQQRQRPNVDKGKETLQRWQREAPKLGNHDVNGDTSALDTGGGRVGTTGTVQDRQPRTGGGSTDDRRELEGDVAPNKVQGGDMSSVHSQHQAVSPGAVLLVLQAEVELRAWKAATAALMAAVAYLLIPVYRIPVHGTLGTALGLVMGGALGTVLHFMSGGGYSR